MKQVWRTCWGYVQFIGQNKKLVAGQLSHCFIQVQKNFITVLNFKSTLNVQKLAIIMSLNANLWKKKLCTVHTVFISVKQLYIFIFPIASMDHNLIQVLWLFQKFSLQNRLPNHIRFWSVPVQKYFFLWPYGRVRWWVRWPSLFW